MTDCNIHTALVAISERLQEILRLWLNGKHRLIDNRPNMTECRSRGVWQSAALPLSLLSWSDYSQASRWALRIDATQCNAIYPMVSPSQRQCIQIWQSAHRLQALAFHKQKWERIVSKQCRFTLKRELWESVKGLITGRGVWRIAVTRDLSRDVIWFFMTDERSASTNRLIND